jgi:hypothetical protein
MRTFVATAALFTCLAIPAFAQTAAPANSSQLDAASAANDQKSPSDTAPSNGSMENKAAIESIRKDLQSAGFTDVKVVAESFVVQAKSKDGNPVVMTIGPHGMSVFEAMTGGSSNAGTVGSGANGATPGNSGSGGASSNSSGPQK